MGVMRILCITLCTGFLLNSSIEAAYYTAGLDAAIPIPVMSEKQHLLQASGLSPEARSLYDQYKKELHAHLDAYLETNLSTIVIDYVPLPTYIAQIDTRVNCIRQNKNSLKFATGTLFMSVGSIVLGATMLHVPELTHELRGAIPLTLASLGFITSAGLALWNCRHNCRSALHDGREETQAETIKEDSRIIHCFSRALASGTGMVGSGAMLIARADPYSTVVMLCGSGSIGFLLSVITQKNIRDINDSLRRQLQNK